jgi:hypothetical protein
MMKPDFISRRSSDINTVEFYADLQRETELAFLFNDGDNDIWLPKSKIKDLQLMDYIQNTYCIVIPECLATDKGIV